MKNVFLFLTAIFVSTLFISATADAGPVRVRGYYKQNGTYVAPHTRTAPDGVKWNNKSAW